MHNVLPSVSSYSLASSLCLDVTFKPKNTLNKIFQIHFKNIKSYTTHLDNYLYSKNKIFSLDISVNMYKHPLYHKKIKCIEIYILHADIIKMKYSL